MTLAILPSHDTQHFKCPSYFSLLTLISYCAFWTLCLYAILLYLLDLLSTYHLAMLLPLWAILLLSSSTTLFFFLPYILGIGSLSFPVLIPSL